MLLFIILILLAALPTTPLRVFNSIEVPHARSSAVSRRLDGISWPSTFPYSRADLTPSSPGSDSKFYFVPKLVHHAGEECRQSLTNFYSCILPPQSTGATLDICSSFTSHYPKNYKAGRSAALGLNYIELFLNPSKTEFKVRRCEV